MGSSSSPSINSIKINARQDRQKPISQVFPDTFKQTTLTTTTAACQDCGIGVGHVGDTSLRSITHSFTPWESSPSFRNTREQWFPFPTTLSKEWHWLQSSSFHGSPLRYLLWEDPDLDTVKSISKLKSHHNTSSENTLQSQSFQYNSSLLNLSVLIYVHPDVDQNFF